MADNKPTYVYNEKGQKVFTITCAESGEVFQHTQVGRGRPPIYSPTVRAQKEAGKSKKTVSLPRGEGVPLASLSLVARNEIPKAGTKAFLVPVENDNWAEAIHQMKTVDVVRVRNGQATVLMPNGERTTAPVKQLVSVGVVAG